MHIIEIVMVFSALVMMLCLVSSNTASADDNNGSFALTVREYRQSADFDNYDTEMDSSYDFKKIELDRDAVALILIDVWAFHPNDGWFERAKKNIKEKVKPLVRLMRDNNIKIIHIPHEYDTYGISPDIKPSDNKPPMIVRSNTSPKGLDVPDIFEGTNEIVIKEYDAEVLSKCLRDHGIRTLIYAGYASNWCVLHRDAGIFNMKNAGFDIVLVRDCTLAIELPETLEGELANKVIMAMVEVHWGPTTTVDDLRNALSQ